MQLHLVHENNSFPFFETLITEHCRIEKLHRNGRNWCVLVPLWRVHFTYGESRGALRTRETNITLKKERSLERVMIKNI